MTSIEVDGTGLHVDRGSVTLTCLGLGSCVCVALWDTAAEIGGMAHVVLPDSRRYRSDGGPGKFADLAPAALFTALRALGANPSRIVAKIAGGANIFSAAAGSRPPVLEVGSRNIRAVRHALDLLRVPIVAEDVGGGVGRSVAFRIIDGRLRVRHTCGPVRDL